MYKVDDFKPVGCLDIKIHSEIEPLCISTRIDVVLQHELILVGACLRNWLITLKAANRLPDSKPEENLIQSSLLRLLTPNEFLISLWKPWNLRL